MQISVLREVCIQSLGEFSQILFLLLVWISTGHKKHPHNQSCGCCMVISGFDINLVQSVKAFKY